MLCKETAIGNTYLHLTAYLGVFAIHVSASAILGHHLRSDFLSNAGLNFKDQDGSSVLAHGL
jgi:hypothetical protein